MLCKVADTEDSFESRDHGDWDADGADSPCGDLVHSPFYLPLHQGYYPGYYPGFGSGNRIFGPDGFIL